MSPPSRFVLASPPLADAVSRTLVLEPNPVFEVAPACPTFPRRRSRCFANGSFVFMAILGCRSAICRMAGPIPYPTRQWKCVGCGSTVGVARDVSSPCSSRKRASRRSSRTPAMLAGPSVKRDRLVRRTQAVVMAGDVPSSTERHVGSRRRRCLRADESKSRKPAELRWARMLAR